MKQSWYLRWESRRTQTRGGRVCVRACAQWIVPMGACCWLPGSLHASGRGAERPTRKEFVDRRRSAAQRALGAKSHDARSRVVPAGILWWFRGAVAQKGSRGVVLLRVCVKSVVLLPQAEKPGSCKPANRSGEAGLGGRCHLAPASQSERGGSPSLCCVRAPVRQLARAHHQRSGDPVGQRAFFCSSCQPTPARWMEQAKRPAASNTSEDSAGVSLQDDDPAVGVAHGLRLERGTRNGCVLR